MKKFAVCSGFLGAGKTSVMMALTRRYNEKYGKSAMICNDLCGADLVDNRFAAMEGCQTSELTGGCICYQLENLSKRLNDLYDTAGCSLVLSDIPGFGVGALEHVYHGLTRNYPGHYSLAPFLVVLEPKRLRMLREGADEDLTYILRAQLSEADLIALNKCDLLSDTERQAGSNWLASSFPHAQVLAVSALTGEGIDSLIHALIQGSASLRLPDIGYGGPAFRRAMGRMSEYRCGCYAQVCCHTFDGTQWLLALAQSVSERIDAANGEIPHLKLLAWSEDGDYGRVDVLGVHRAVQVGKAFDHRCTDLALQINSSAMCDAAVLSGAIEEALAVTADTFQLNLTFYEQECFGVGQ